MESLTYCRRNHKQIDKTTINNNDVIDNITRNIIQTILEHNLKIENFYYTKYQN